MTKNKFWVSCLEIASRYGLPVIAFACTVATYYNLTRVGILLAVFTLVITCFAEHFYKKSYSALAKEKEQESIRCAKIQAENTVFRQNIDGLFEHLLKEFAENKLNFGNSHDRITLYLHDNNKSFVPCGRYSDHPEYAKKNRTQFLDHEGCISKGWRDDWHFISHLPSENEAYEQRLKNDYCLTSKTIEGLRMKSRLYAVQRVKNEKGKPIAIIVVESMKADRFREEDLNSPLSEFAKSLGSYIETIGDSIPVPSIARAMEL